MTSNYLVIISNNGNTIVVVFCESASAFIAIQVRGDRKFNVAEYRIDFPTFQESIDFSN